MSARLRRYCQELWISNRHDQAASSLFSSLRCCRIPPTNVTSARTSGSLFGASAIKYFGEMTLRLYGALSYSQNSARDLRCALNGA